MDIGEFERLARCFDCPTRLEVIKRADHNFLATRIQLELIELIADWLCDHMEIA